MIAVEEQLGKSLTNVFTPVDISIQGNAAGIGDNLKLPSIKEIAVIFWGAVKSDRPNITFADSCKLVDDYLEKFNGLEGVYELYTLLGRACSFFKDAPSKTVTAVATVKKVTTAAKKR